MKDLDGKGEEEEKAMNIFVQLALGVHMCHSNKIIHKNLSLDHLLFAAPDKKVIKLIGFGTTREAVKSISVASTFTGKNAFCPPETVIGGEYLMGADIWALGCILHRMIAGKLAWFMDAD